MIALRRWTHILHTVESIVKKGMNMSSIWRMTATELADAFARGDLSSREAVEASVDRIRDTEGASNAFEEVFDDAIALAEEADRERAGGNTRSALHGVPVAVKSNHDIAGRPTTSGVAAFSAAPPAPESSPVVDRLREAGAIIVGRTRMPAGGFRWSTQSEEFGPTYNPWNVDVTAGASSGGAGVAVAVGDVPIAIGNDIGGSVRYPAAVNGVMGLRPSVGRVPAWLGAQPGQGTPNSIAEYCVEGPIARTADDLRTALDIIGRPDARDPYAVPYSRPYDPVTRPRVAVVRGSDGAFSSRNTPGVDAALTAAANGLARDGYEVSEIDSTLVSDAAGLWCELALLEFDNSGFSDYMDQFGGDSSNTVWKHAVGYARETFGIATVMSAYDAMKRRNLLRRQVSELMEEFPILLTASSGQPPFVWGTEENPDTIRGLIRHQWMNLGLPLLGLPVVGMATTVGDDHIPLGVQIVGRTFAENQILDVAADLRRQAPVKTPLDPAKR